MNRKMIAKMAIILAGAAFSSGCAPLISGAMNVAVDENSIHEKTASYFGVPRESIKISSIEKGALSTSFRTTYLGKMYNCSIYYGDVNCSQPGASNDQNVKAGAGGRLTAPVAVSETQAATNNPTMSTAQAQVRLNQLGYPVGVPDGVFGKKSVEKLKLFQKSQGLAMSGKLDSPTIEALR
ncbi:MAG: peptidoglycan-binding domain-containing protein [Pseudomonadota bacterium]